VINNVGDVLSIWLSRQCDQQRSAVGSAIHVVLRPCNGWLAALCVALVPLCPSVRPATWDTSRSKTFPSTSSLLFCYGGWSQIMAAILATQLLLALY